MASFDAASAVEPMHCKLKPFADFDAIIPEPTTEQLQAFINARSLESERARDRLKDLPDDATAGQVAEILTGEAVLGDRQRTADMYSAVCSGKPSADDLMKLPHREFTAFARWLTQEMLDPEAVTGAGNGQGQTQPSAAAG